MVEKPEIVVSVRAEDLLALMGLLREAHALLHATEVPLASSRKAASKLLDSALSRMACLKLGDPRYEVIAPVIDSSGS